MKCCSVLILLALASLSVSPLYAQGTPTSSDAIQRAYNGIKGNIMKAADKMPEGDYDFKPTPEQRNFGGWIAHVADAQVTICSKAAGNPMTSNAGSKTSKADIIAALKMSFDACDAVYSALTEANSNDSVASFRGNTTRLAALAGNVAHDNECYGTIAVYLRLKGIVPPSTEAMAARGR
jgi:hypothetical protein